MSTLILVGEKDIVTPPSAAQALKEKIANSELQIVPNAAHMSNLENPEVFNKHLVNLFPSQVSRSLSSCRKNRCV